MGGHSVPSALGFLSPRAASDTQAFSKPDSQGYWPRGSCGAWHTDVAGAREAGSGREGLGLGPAQIALVPQGGTTQNKKMEIFGSGGELCKLSKIPRCWLTNQKAILGQSLFPSGSDGLSINTRD